MPASDAASIPARADQVVSPVPWVVASPPYDLTRGPLVRFIATSLQAITRCHFEETDPDSDQLVLMKVLDIQCVQRTCSNAFRIPDNYLQHRAYLDSARIGINRRVLMMLYPQNCDALSETQHFLADWTHEFPGA